MNKKVCTRMFASALLALAALGSVYAQSDSPACNNKLIRGGRCRCRGN
jgi:hypothetical protein